MKATTAKRQRSRVVEAARGGRVTTVAEEALGLGLGRVDAIYIQWGWAARELG